MQCLLDGPIGLPPPFTPLHYFITEGMKASSPLEHSVITADEIKRFPVTSLLHLCHILAFGPAVGSRRGYECGPHRNV